MVGLSSGQKTQLAIAPCTVSDGKISVTDPKNAQKKWFEVMINPSNYSHSYTISNTSTEKGSQGKKGAQGANENPPKYIANLPQKVGFDIVIDGTGVVIPPGAALALPDVKTQIANLIKVVYTYVGKEHEPNPVRVLWGSFVFFGTLDSMSMDYTLFKPSGAPLRAKVKLSFTGHQSSEEGSLKANTSSPDLDHVIEVKSGDTLPLLCYRVYKDSGYYPAVAKVNNLVNFRNLVPGTRLRFPPLR